MLYYTVWFKTIWYNEKRSIVLQIPDSGREKGRVHDFGINIADPRQAFGVHHPVHALLWTYPLFINSLHVFLKLGILIEKMAKR